MADISPLPPQADTALDAGTGFAPPLVAAEGDGLATVRANQFGLLSPILSTVFGQIAHAVAAVVTYYEQMSTKDVGVERSLPSATPSAAALLTAWPPQSGLSS